MIIIGIVFCNIKKAVVTQTTVALRNVMYTMKLTVNNHNLQTRSEKLNFKKMLSCEIKHCVKLLLIIECLSTKFCTARNPIWANRFLKWVFHWLIFPFVWTVRLAQRNSTSHGIPQRWSSFIGLELISGFLGIKLLGHIRHQYITNHLFTRKGWYSFQ